MAITGKPLIRGLFMLASFAILFLLVLMPIWPGPDGEKLTGLQFADAAFNGLSKGSSYFIPEAELASGAMTGKSVSLAPRLANAEQAALAARILQKAGMEVKLDGSIVSFSGDLGSALKAAVHDSDLLYNNDGEAVSERYGGAEPLSVARAWWHALNPCIRQLQRQGHNLEAEAVQDVVKRAIEPGNNFYGIKAQKISANVFLVLSLLLFYVLYTLWYGFGMYEIFEGLGLLEGKPEK